jgi:hypothetical protein
MADAAANLGPDQRMSREALVWLALRRVCRALITPTP